jgi:hypothetical protein
MTSREERGLDLLVVKDILNCLINSKDLGSYSYKVSAQI